MVRETVMNYDRREFIKKTAAGMAGVAFAGSNISRAAEGKKKKPKTEKK